MLNRTDLSLNQCLEQGSIHIKAQQASLFASYNDPNNHQSISEQNPFQNPSSCLINITVPAPYKIKMFTYLSRNSEGDCTTPTVIRINRIPYFTFQNKFYFK